MIVYTITSHGFGHAVRACEVIRNLKPDLPLTLRTAVPEWFLEHELGSRCYKLAPAEFDCGVLGPDSARVDLARTVRRMERLFIQNEARIDEEAAFLKRIGARVVVSDVPSFPLRAAREAGVPSILIANFTWSAIYEHLAAHFCPSGKLKARAESVIGVMQREYDMGDLLLATDMQIPMHACRQRRDVPMIARRGVNRRADLIEKLRLDPSRPIGLLYLGRDGMEGIEWPRLAGLEIQILAFAVPPGAESLIHPLPEDLIDHADASSSVDVVIAKPGYGICGECIAADTPLIYPPRPEFAEMQAVDPLLERWGGGIPIGEEDFRSLNWQPCLDRCKSLQRHPEAVDCTGGRVCAEWIERYWRNAPDFL